MSIRIGQNLRAMRKSFGLSQAQLATILGITFQQVQKYEAGQNRLSIEKAIYLSEHLEIPIQAFIDGLKDQPAYQHDPLSTLSARKRRLYHRFIKALQNMPDTDMNMFITLLDIIPDH
ncbi:MAG: helix-turn-helix domain-containing protein [Chitinophagales bacterium]|nr:helix-turn-helix domain-containing protein [Chitinophagales bacterium]